MTIQAIDPSWYATRLACIDEMRRIKRELGDREGELLCEQAMHGTNVRERIEAFQKCCEMLAQADKEETDQERITMLEALTDGFLLTPQRRIQLVIAAELGADWNTLVVLRGALSVSSTPTIGLPSGCKNRRTCVGPGKHKIAGMHWDVAHVRVGPELWTIAD